MADHASSKHLAAAQIYQLRRLTTPTVFNGWELITRRNAARECFNLDQAHDFAPQLGPMAGYAVTAIVRVGGPADPDHRRRWGEFRSHTASLPGPKIIVVQDLDRPNVYGSIWGEIGANTFRSLGCVGTIVDGGVRDVDEMAATGFKSLARRACVGHGVGTLVDFNCDVNVFGVTVAPGQLIHADQHGFLAIPPEDEARVLDAAMFLDAGEADLLRAAKNSPGQTHEQFLQQFDAAIDAFVRRIADSNFKRGEW